MIIMCTVYVCVNIYVYVCVSVDFVSRTQRSRRRENHNRPLCTLATDLQISLFLTEGLRLVKLSCVAREQLMACFSGDQSVGVC